MPLTRIGDQPQRLHFVEGLLLYRRRQMDACKVDRHRTGVRCNGGIKATLRGAVLTNGSVDWSNGARWYLVTEVSVHSIGDGIKPEKTDLMPSNPESLCFYLFCFPFIIVAISSCLHSYLFGFRSARNINTQEEKQQAFQVLAVANDAEVICSDHVEEDMG